MDCTAGVDAGVVRSKTDAYDKIQKRYDALLESLREEAPEIFDEQGHLESGTSERAYWNYGYLMALRDVLALFGASTPRH